MHSFDVVGYQYRADNYCEACIDVVVFDSLSKDERRRIHVFVPDMYEVARAYGIDPEDEASYDSDEFPKVIFADQCEEDERCGSCFEELMW